MVAPSVNEGGLYTITYVRDIRNMQMAASPEDIVCLSARQTIERGGDLKPNKFCYHSNTSRYRVFQCERAVIVEWCSGLTGTPISMYQKTRAEKREVEQAK